VKILVTGAAGFIGSHVSHLLIGRGHEVVGLDNMNEYYDVTLKQARLARLEKLPAFRFVKLDLADNDGIAQLFAREKFQRVVHLAAQAGVRYSLEAPHAYVQSNVTGTLNILEGCRHNTVEHLVYASTSSVYGANTNMPFSVHNIADHPLSLYATTKRANERDLASARLRSGILRGFRRSGPCPELGRSKAITSDVAFIKPG
jgi:UDP-glucuronate 4-epimerase